MSEKIDQLVVYGDSYSDIQPATKRTNGPLWSQQLATSWDTKLVSFAQPGSTFCKSDNQNGSWLQKQVEAYTSQKDGEQPKSTVHAIFFGVTELIETKGEATHIKAWIDCVKDQVKSISSDQADARILIMGVPALEYSPYAATKKEIATTLKQNIMDFNVALEEEVLTWQDENKNIEFFDTYLVFSDTLGDPSIAKIDNVDDSYWDKCQGQCNEKMNSYLWWDSVHVTGAGHRAISSTIQSKEYFSLKSTETSSLDEFENITTSGVYSKQYTRCLSWFILACILVMFLYMFRHNKLVVYLKKTIQTKVFRMHSSKTSRGSNHEYALV